MLQLDEITLYAAGLALLEQNLHTLSSQGLFEKLNLTDCMMSTREPLEWHFKQLDHAVGLSFKSNFHFALVGHLLKVILNSVNIFESALQIIVNNFNIRDFGIRHQQQSVEHPEF